MRGKQEPKVALSIDFDYFIRENPLWDFGHNESLTSFHQSVWNIRYGSVNLYEETDVKKYADIDPGHLIEELEVKGFKFSPEVRLCLADSHMHAYAFFKKRRVSEMYHLDAHHDMYQTSSMIDCGNWLHRYWMENRVKEIHWIYPTWLDEFGGAVNQFNYKIDIRKFKDVKLDQPVSVGSVFICRSGVWVPPHHDPEFLEMLLPFTFKTKKISITPDLKKRTYPNREDALKYYQEQRAIIESLQRATMAKDADETHTS